MNAIHAYKGFLLVSSLLFSFPLSAVQFWGLASAQEGHAWQVPSSRGSVTVGAESRISLVCLTPSCMHDVGIIRCMNRLDVFFFFKKVFGEIRVQGSKTT